MNQNTCNIINIFNNEKTQFVGACKKTQMKKAKKN